MEKNGSETGKEQTVMQGNSYVEFQKVVRQKGLKKIFLVCGKSLEKYETGKSFLQDENIGYIFQDFRPNPLYESVKQAVKKFQQNKCDAILAVGGGSAMDVAKAVKAFATDNIEDGIGLQERPIMENSILFMAVPTTAGTGSEATRFAVVYDKGEKQSVEGEMLLPQMAFLDSAFLEDLPEYQKKVTFLDAFCHAVESFWSPYATAASRAYAREAIRIILHFWKGYLAKEKEASNQMLMAAHLAGRAINITKTTGAHAMCYKLTTLYGLPHGHAAALCLKQIWTFTCKQAYREGNHVLQGSLQELAACLEKASAPEAIEWYAALLRKLEIGFPKEAAEKDIPLLCQSVNQSRMKNHPIKCPKDDICRMYFQILFGEKESAGGL